ncbi:hypothetical protein NQ317_014978 [Molorchus minor]|uniref:C2H2-type domain-containing protein n=1 Tax=Molorchus minor TaxID=1323400 RepID=A0ABQ9JCM1_9CUCU|nr:hypothetical protein NQ317_014978 [Molorchus minor]
MKPLAVNVKVTVNNVTFLHFLVPHHVEEGEEGAKALESIFKRTNYKCKNCGLMYVRKSSLSNHIRRECGKEPNLVCIYCSYRTKIKGNLRRHYLMKHSDQKNQQFNQELLATKDPKKGAIFYKNTH